MQGTHVDNAGLRHNIGPQDGGGRSIADNERRGAVAAVHQGVARGRDEQIAPRERRRIRNYVLNDMPHDDGFLLVCRVAGQIGRLDGVVGGDQERTVLAVDIDIVVRQELQEIRGTSRGGVQGELQYLGRGKGQFEGLRQLACGDLTFSMG